MVVFVFRYDSVHGRFTDPPSEYTTTVDETENHKYCESCLREAAQQEVRRRSRKGLTHEESTLVYI